MKKILVIVFGILVCLSLTSCVYDSCNIIRAHGTDILVIEPAGVVHLTNATITIMRTMNSKSHVESATAYSIPPNYLEFEPDGTVGIGDMTTIPTPQTATQSSGVTTPAVSATTTGGK